MSRFLASPLLRQLETPVLSYDRDQRKSDAILRILKLTHLQSRMQTQEKKKSNNFVSQEAETLKITRDTKND